MTLHGLFVTLIVILLLARKSSSLVCSPEIVINRSADVLFFQSNKLLQVERIGKPIGRRKMVLILVLRAEVWQLLGLLTLVAAHEVGGELSRLSEVLCEHTFDHLVLHLL